MKKIKYLFLIALLFTGLSISAATLPSHYPGNLQYGGVVNKIDMAGEIIVGRELFLISPVLKVYTPKSRVPTNISAIKKGDMIAYDYTSNESGQNIIIRIWILTDRNQLPPRG